MTYNVIILAMCFFLIALVYSSVGFGGGSSYLALLAQPFFMLLPEVIRPTALLCNVIVVTGGCIIFYKAGKIVWREVWPFLVMSVPLAYVGGLWKLDQQTFFLLLGFTLIAAGIFLWIKPSESIQKEKYNTTTTNMLMGGGIGFLSGLVGIGGGIFLSPVLHLLGWADAKKISALASLFILVNSLSGLAGQWSRGLPTLEVNFIAPLLLAVFVGGQIGSRLGARRFDPIMIKRITAVLIFLAGLNVVADHW